jgi:transcriptional regulator with XRE-family HTH domain
MKFKGINYKSKLGEFLREARKEAELSQEAFADKLGINRTYYGNLERGENAISIEKLQEISRVLNIPLSELFKQVEKL